MPSPIPELKSEPKQDRIIIHNKALLTDFDQVSTLKKDNVNVLLNQMKELTDDNLSGDNKGKEQKPKVSQMRQYSSEI